MTPTLSVPVRVGTGVTARNNVRQIGPDAGPGARTLLFAHGFGCDQNMWRFVAPAFAADHRVVLFDYVGAGRSDRSAYDPERYDRLDGYADDVLEICAALDLRDVVFVGHSVGAMIGLLAAIREPGRFSRLVHVTPSPCYLDDPATGYVGGFTRPDLEDLLEMMDKNYLGWANLLAPLAMGDAVPELVAELEGSFCSTDPNIARQFAEVTFFSDNRADLFRSPVPSLILQCSDDALVPPSVGEYLRRSMPCSTLRVLRASGHCPHMSHPEETVRAIREYLDGDGPQTADA